MTTSLILNSKGKDKFWFGDVSAGLANDKGYIFNQSVLLFPETGINSVNFKYMGEFDFRLIFRINGGKEYNR
jgi:hypothetical protein